MKSLLLVALSSVFVEGLTSSVFVVDTANTNFELYAWTELIKLGPIFAGMGLIIYMLYKRTMLLEAQLKEKNDFILSESKINTRTLLVATEALEENKIVLNSLVDISNVVRANQNTTIVMLKKLTEIKQK